MARQSTLNRSPQKPEPPSGPESADLIKPLLRWYVANRRDLPWRDSGPPGGRDAYQTLVSEFMLQQTQVSRVLEKFEPFLARFPAITDLAKAPESSVLTAWSGLGYYRRARLLHAAAQDVMTLYEGKIPSSVEELMELRGIGRYTAGAIASMAFDQRVPLVDGNVSRVLQRVYAKPGRVADKVTTVWTWQTADALVQALPREKSAGMFNEALMELGATVCTPKAPRCGTCPWSKVCQSRTLGKVESIPAPKLRIEKQKIHLAALIVRLGPRSVLIEDRDDSGLFANLTQPPMLEITADISDRELRVQAAEYLGITSAALGATVHLGTLTHTLTHRELHITAIGVRPRTALKLTTFNRRGAQREDLANLPLANIHRKLLLLGLDFASETQPLAKRYRGG